MEANNNNKLNIACMGHNAYWYYAEKFALEQGCTLDNFGGATLYFLLKADVDKNPYDVLILFSNEHYKESEEDSLDDIADAIREKSGKDITVAYLYCIPEEERENKNTDGVKIKKVTEDGIIIKSYFVDGDYDVVDLIYDTLEVHKNGMNIATPVMKTLTNEEEHK